MADFSQLKYYNPDPKPANPEVRQADLIIYGGTSTAIATAVQADREGLSVIIVSPDKKIGGMTASGLGATDIGNKAAIGGLSRSFYQRLGKHYGEHEVWAFEPKVAEATYEAMLSEIAVKTYRNEWLDTVEKSSTQITAITCESGHRYEGRIFVDATYEGDLLAKAGVSYHFGRESVGTYREHLAGKHFGHPGHNFRAFVDPYVQQGKPDSGLVWGVSDEAPGVQGEGDACMQAYNFRVCLCNDPEVRVPFPEPPQYDPARYELLARYIATGCWDALSLTVWMPNGKTDTNNHGAFSSDNIGRNHKWPDGSYAEREVMFQDHVNYNLGMYYFLVHDDRVPQQIKDELADWGLPGDEFVDTANWPHGLYVREARRMISDLVMTEEHCMTRTVVDDPVGLAAYQMDSHNNRRIVLEGRAINEGNVETSVGGPFRIAYRAIRPRGEECTNLLVPGCLSSSHIAYGSIRMEPVFMILGQSAASAAALAIAGDTTVQEIDYKKLEAKLRADGQVLDWPPATAVTKEDHYSNPRSKQPRPFQPRYAVKW